MHVVNKSAEWSSTTNPVRHHASQSSAQGQPANQPEGARRSKSNNPTCSHHGSLCALSRIYQSWPLHCCSARFVCACPHTFSHLIIDQRAACLRYKHNHASDGGRKDKTMLCNVGRACRLCNTKSWQKTLSYVLFFKCWDTLVMGVWWQTGVFLTITFIFIIIREGLIVRDSFPGH